VYALGVLLYELVTGRLPFVLRNASDAVRFHMSEPPPFPPALPETYPKALSKLLNQSLQRNPSDRPEGAGAFTVALQKISASLMGGFESDQSGSVQENIPVGDHADVTKLSLDHDSKPGSSVWKKFSTPPPSSTDALEIFTSAGTFQTVALGKEPISIGRDEDSDIVLDDPKVSRQHARLSFDGENYRITDLNSTNGTFLDNTRLLPGSLDIWQPDKSLRVGDHYLRLVRFKGNQEERLSRQEGTLIDIKMGVMSEAGGRLGVVVPQASLSVEPGSAVELSFTCVNQGLVDDTILISVIGLPAGWVTVEPSSLHLPPLQPIRVVRLIQPPRQPTSRATRYHFILRLASQSNQAETVETRCAVTVLPYIQFSSQLKPSRLMEGKQGRVWVQNQGNAVEIFTIDLKDRANVLIFQIDQMKLKIPEGESVETFFTVQAKKKKWVGTTMHPFTAFVSVEHVPGSSAKPVAVQELSGEFVSRGIAAWWFIVLIAFLLMVALGGFIFLMLFR
jgi:hypothetical protein